MRSLGDEMATPLPSKGEKDANAGKPGERAPTAGGLIPEEEAFDQAASESVFADAIRRPTSNSAPGCGCPMAAKATASHRARQATVALSPAGALCP